MALFGIQVVYDLNWNWQLLSLSEPVVKQNIMIDPLSNGNWNFLKEVS